MTTIPGFSYGTQPEIENVGLVLHEHTVLRKFDGDSTAPEDLAEVIVIDDGVITDHWYRGDERDAPAE